MNRPFKVLGIQQIAIGGLDKHRLQKLWVDLLGLEVTGTFKSERENVDEDICALGHGAAEVEVDLMQPLDPEKKPAVHTTPLNHIGLWIDDLPVAVQWIGWLSPLWHSTEIGRILTIGAGLADPSLLVHVLFLSAIGFGGLVLAHRQFEKRLTA